MNSDFNIELTMLALGIVAQTHNLSTWEPEAEESYV